MHVAFHGGDHHLAVAGTFLFTGFDKGFQIRHRLLHDASGFDHLRQEHFALAEQIPDHVHAVHQWPFDHFNRACGLLACLFGILFDKLGDAFHQRILKTLIHVPGAPLGLLDVGTVVGFAAAVFFSQLQHALGGVVAAVQNHVFNRVAQFGRQVVINRQLPGVDDTHIHAVTDGVVEKYRVDRFTHRVVTAERERDVGDTA